MKKTISAVLFLSIVITLLLQSAGLAWMSDNGMSSPVHITSNVHKQYFEGGNGTKEDPYQIASAVQLYYFAWLQYLGYFNTEDKDDNGEIDTFYFVLNNDIDMHEVDHEGNEIDYILPPIGTTDNPFIGNFDGCGYTVKNATVENLYSSLIEPPEQTTEENFEGVEIIGFFGVVGEIKGEHKYDYESSANEVKNLVLENLTVKTQTKQSLIGLVAGYVNGTVDCVGIMGGTVNIVNGVEALSFTANISDYSLIGYCEKEYKDSVYVMDVVLSKPTTSDTYEVVPDMTEGGSSQGWGGSIKMLDIYELIQNYQTNTNVEYQQNFNYIISRVDRVGLDGKRVTLDQETSSMIVADIISRENGEAEHHGSFVFSQMSQGNTMDINFVSGSQQVTLFEYVKDENSSVPLYHITDGAGHYLSLNGTTITSTDKANATAWYVEDTANGKVIYALVENTIYYLNTSGTSVVVTSYLDLEDFENPPAWQQAGNSYALNGAVLDYENNAWTTTLPKFRIAHRYNNNKYYLTRNNNNQLQNNVTNDSSASLWEITPSGTGYTVSTVVTANNGTTTRYYLNYNNTTLSISNTGSPSIWQYNGTQLFFQTTSMWGGTTTYYLQYYRNGWQARNSSANLIFEADGEVDASATIESSTQSGAEIRLQKTVYVDNSPTNSYYDANGNLTHNLKSNGDAAAGVSYIPLSFDTENKTNKTLSGNTGYIISSKYGDINNGEIDQYGNIRISRYSTEGHLEGYKKPYTITYKTGGENATAADAKFRTIPDIPDIPDKITTDYLSLLGLQKYDKCYKKFRETVADPNGNLEDCFGLHFMEASVTMDNLTEITATLLGETYYNYEVPTNCIDFSLFESGFVNCFGGSYFTSNGVNDSFFSLYEISRDEETLKITDIKEIYKVYGKLTGTGADRTIDTSAEYVYTYKGLKDGGTEGELADYVEIVEESIPDGYVEIFNCLWLIHPDESSLYGSNSYFSEGSPSEWADNLAFYFEIPLNKGEYALGSSAGRTGAYLVYLDLAANAQVIERYQEAEKIVEEKTETSVPKGVELLAPGETSSTVDPLDSAFVSINTKGDGTTAASGDISYSTADGITITHSATSGTSAEYIGANNVLQDGNGNPMELQGVTTEIIRTTYRDYNKTTKETIVTVITKTTVDGGEPSYKRTITKTSADGEVTVKEDEESEPETASVGETQASAGEELIRLYFAYGHTENVTETGDVTIKENVTIEYLYVPAEKDAQGNATTTPSYEITVTNSGTETVKLKAVLLQTGSGITFYVNGTALQDTTTAQTVEIAGSGSNSDPTP